MANKRKNLKKKRNKVKQNNKKTINNIENIRFLTPHLLEKLRKFLSIFLKLKLNIYQYILLLGLVKGLLISRGTLLTNMARQKYFNPKKIKNYIKSVSRSMNTCAEKISLEEFKLYFLAQGLGKIRKNTLILVDFSDISKPRGRKFEYLDYVHDGSANKIKPGYWVLTIIGFDRKRNLYIPLVLDTYSLKANDVLSQNEILFKRIKEIKDKLKGNGIYIFDCGFDDKKLLNILEGEKFILCGKADREIYIEDQKRKMLEYVEELCQLSRSNPIYKVESKRNKKKIRLLLNTEFKKIEVKDIKQSINLVCSYDNIRNTNRFYLTSLKVENFDDSISIVRLYLERWKIEEFLQFIKTHFGLEKFRIRKYKSIQLLTFLILLAFMFLTEISISRNKKMKLLLQFLSQSISKKMTIHNYIRGISMLFLISLIIEEFIRHP